MGWDARRLGFDFWRVIERWEGLSQGKSQSRIFRKAGFESKSFGKARLDVRGFLLSQVCAIVSGGEEKVGRWRSYLVLF